MQSTQQPWPTTNHADPWALIRRGGAEEGKRPFTRLVYLTRTYVPRGQTVAAAMKGYLVSLDRYSRPHITTKHEVRVPWEQVVRRWRVMPSKAQIAAAKKRLSKELKD